MELTIEEKIAYFNMIKEGVKKEILSIADKNMEFDDEAQQEVNRFNSFNSDCGAGGGFDDLSEPVQERLIEEASEEFINNLDDVFQDGSYCQQVLVKIVRGLI